MSRIANQDYLVSEQYHDSAKFQARVQLHARFSTNAYGWLRWVFDQLGFPPSCDVLELGSGPGHLWRDNLARIPADWNITLSDLSPGMVAEARANLHESGHAFGFEVIDAQAIPFPDASFDAVVANHMLYHVPDREKAYAEIRRVLRPRGRLRATTVGETHLRELFELGMRFDPALVPWAGAPASSFRLETGAAELQRWFSEVQLVRYPDALEVTEAEPLAAFIASMVDAPTLDPRRYTELLRFVERELAETGPIHITKDSGIFSAVRPAQSAEESAP